MSRSPAAAIRRQATVFLAEHAANVTQSPAGRLRDTMSQYLVERIEGLPNVTVVTSAEIAALKGEGGAWESICLRDWRTGEESWRDVRYLFSFIGAEPTPTGSAPPAFNATSRASSRPAATTDCRSKPAGKAAVGDVRAGSVKPRRPAVGDAQVVAAIHAISPRRRGDSRRSPWRQPPLPDALPAAPLLL